MIDFLKSIFSGQDVDDGAEHEELQVAVCAVLLEVAHSNDHVTSEEEQRIDHLIEKYFHLTDADLNELKKKATAARENSVDLYYFTKTIRQNYSIEEREKVLDMMWKVVYADGEIDKYEESICRRLTDLIGLEHQHYMKSKLKIAKMKH
ncbi:MAG: TerB family tellurite resistance protein [Oligoflexus sp.]